MKPLPNISTVKAWLSEGKPMSYVRERNMTQLSMGVPSDDMTACRVLHDFAASWTKERGETYPPIVVHTDERNIALYVRWGLRKGEALFNAVKEAKRWQWPADSTSEAKSRRAFEKWRKSSGYQDKRDTFGRYTTPEGRAAWQSWQASRKQETAVPSVADESLVSEYLNGYKAARERGFSITAAELEGIRAVKALLLPVIAPDLSEDAPNFSNITSPRFKNPEAYNIEQAA